MLVLNYYLLRISPFKILNNIFNKLKLLILLFFILLIYSVLTHKQKLTLNKFSGKSQSHKS